MSDIDYNRSIATKKMVDNMHRIARKAIDNHKDLLGQPCYNAPEGCPDNAVGSRFHPLKAEIDDYLEETRAPQYCGYCLEYLWDEKHGVDDPTPY